MPLYRIRRNIGEASQEDIDAASFRAIVCAPQFPGLKWVRSFWDPESGRIDCFYEAQDSHQIVEHAGAARIPCDEIHEVREVLPEMYV